MEEIVKELGNKIDAYKNETVSKAEYDTLKGELEALKGKETVDKATFDALETKLNDLALTVNEEKETGKNAQSLSKEISAKKESIRKIAKGSSDVEVIKALTNRASVASTQQAFDLTDVGQLATRKLSLYDIFPKVQVSSSNNNGTIRYYDWDEATIARAAASVAEGAAFPESTAKFKRSSITIEKIGDTLPVTEEFFEDEEMFASELELFLNNNVALEVDDQLANADGTSNTLLGLYSSINAYTPTEEGIVDANLFDLVVKVSEAITTTGGSKYTPNVIIARKSVINQMKLKKDGENNYMMPPFVSADGRNVDGMTVIESNVCPANTLVVGDSRFAKIYEKTGIELSKGYTGSQFVEDEMTLKARKRLAFLIRYADKGGWLKVTDIADALATLATVPE
jgi:hypothetical protein